MHGRAGPPENNLSQATMPMDGPRRSRVDPDRARSCGRHSLSDPTNQGMKMPRHRAHIPKMVRIEACHPAPAFRHRIAGSW